MRTYSIYMKLESVLVYGSVSYTKIVLDILVYFDYVECYSVTALIFFQYSRTSL